MNTAEFTGYVARLGCCGCATVLSDRPPDAQGYAKYDAEEERPLDGFEGKLVRVTVTLLEEESK